MEKILFVGISDIHVNVSNIASIESKLKKFTAKINHIKMLDQYDEVILIVSGDIAYSGKSSEYNLIRDSFIEISKSMKIVMCPGNHDHDFSAYSGNARQVLLDTSTDKIDDGIIEIVTQGQKPYFDFSNEITNINASESNALSSVYIFEKYKICIQSLNTAWCSKIKEEGGKLIFPIDKISSLSNNYKKIIFFHHPLAWFSPNNQKELRNFLRENFDVVISGHEHEQDSFKVSTNDSNTLFIESILFESDEVNFGGFYTFVIDNRDVKVSSYVYKSGEFEIGKNYSQKEILKESAIHNNNFRLTTDFSERLREVGSGFIHEGKENLDIEDVFVYPNVSSRKNGKETLNRVSTRDIFNEKNLSKVIIFGEESSGKSALLRKFYIDFFKKDEISVLININDSKSGRKLDFKEIEKAIQQQYQDLSPQKYFESSNRKILMVDDFDCIKGTRDSLNRALEKVSSKFDLIILTVSDSSEMGYSLMPELSDYEFFDLLKIGYKLRYEIVNNWNKIKEKCSVCRKTLIHENSESLKIINGIIGKNYIPSNPFFLLTILQSIDGGASSDMNTSSYGYYYQYLITSSLGASSIKKEQLDEIFNYIKELAFHFYKNNVIEEELSSLWDFNAYFCKEYGLKIDVSNRIDKLVDVKILDSKNGFYKFKYPYIYYFFT
jgi:predicted phosphodiesterase/hypoxanthine phosphoribosyltransferase